MVRPRSAETLGQCELLDGALLIARDAYPGLDADRERERFEQLAAPLLRHGVGSLDAPAQVFALGAYLSGDCGFRGNEDDYYDPDNSFLNVVLDRRLGIPISLAVVYLEVARRAGIQASGVGFPGHFLVRVDDDEQTVIIDPFSGQALGRPELKQLLAAATNSRMQFTDTMLDPAPTPHILARMLMNLRGIYAGRGEYQRLLLVLDRLIELMPDAVEQVRDRGFLYAKLGAPGAAVEDLQRYAAAIPHAQDVPEIEGLISALEQDVPKARN